MIAGFEAAARRLNGYLDEQLEMRGLSDENLALIGFSQGTMMSLHVGLRREKPMAAIVGFSGMLAAPERLEAEIRVRPPVALVHGEADDVVPFSRMAEAAQALHAQNVPVATLSRPGLGHSIDQEGFSAAAQFLIEKLPK